MNVKSPLVAMALLVALSAPVLAEEKVKNGGFDGSLNDWEFSSQFNKAASGVADVGVVDTVGLFRVSGSIAQTLSLDVGKYLFSFDGFFGGSNSSSLIASIGNTTVGEVLLQTFTGSGISGNHEFEFNVATKGDYELYFESLALGFLGYVAVDNVSVSSVVAVPGPEAGAGLAGLAMAGMYAWASRRRKAKVAA